MPSFTAPKQSVSIYLHELRPKEPFSQSARYFTIAPFQTRRVHNILLYTMMQCRVAWNKSVANKRLIKFQICCRPKNATIPPRSYTTTYYSNPTPRYVWNSTSIRHLTCLRTSHHWPVPEVPRSFRGNRISVPPIPTHRVPTTVSIRTICIYSITTIPRQRSKTRKHIPRTVRRKTFRNSSFTLTSQFTKTIIPMVPLFRNSPLDLHLSTIQVMKILHHNTLNRFLGIKGDEPKPPWPVSNTVLHHHNVSYPTKPLKVLLKLLLRYTSR
ncbi:hypothetical protein V8G54_008081 [Vigna mungo]|uniref:Uncharacterized protein n=1 Tax=Vigna mungo TaxID=3915 RepID=A0AAQ3P2V5_VIGMU